MIVIRPLLWPDDRESVLLLDTSFITDRIYRVAPRDQTFALEEQPVAPPLQKSYPLADRIEGLATSFWVQVAGNGTDVVGLVAMRIEDWNRRGRLHDLYVAPSARGRGVGRALVDAALAEARRRHARCLWAETQTINYGAIQFYLRVGFDWCGLDTSLYDPEDVGADEIAVFFSHTVEQ